MSTDTIGWIFDRYTSTRSLRLCRRPDGLGLAVEVGGVGIRLTLDRCRVALLRDLLTEALAQMPADPLVTTEAG